jgi:tetratricopeptide (TPR) repeat protein
MSKDDDRIPVEIDPVDERPTEPLPLRAEPTAAMPFTQELTLEHAPPAPSVKGTDAIWHVPFDGSPHFTGRDQILASLHASLRKTDPLSRTQALVGMAGVGKTQIALEYALRHRRDYPLVWWLRADSESSLIHDCNLLTHELFPGAPERNPEAARAAVRAELERRSDWLLIFDGGSDPTAVAAYLPPRHRGHVIVTSRNPNWRGIGTAFPVGPLARNESIHFLLHRSGRTNETVFTAGQLAKALGDLPLALDQAAALIEQARISFEEYLRRFERHWADLLRRGRSGDKHDSIAMSLELSFHQLETTAPAAAELLNLLSFVGPDGFHKQWLVAGADALGDPLALTVGHALYLDESIAALLRYSLIEVNAHRAISMHTIVSALARDRLSHEQRTEWSHRALRLMEASFSFDGNDPRTWSQSAAMLPHALAAVEFAQQTDVTVAAAAALLNQIGQCLYRAARYEEARVAFDRALSIAYRIYGENNPRLSAIANNLGRVLLKLGDAATARQQFEWALSLDENSYGHNHTHVAEVLNNYGLCLVRLDETEAAVAQFQRALAIYEARFGPSHPNTASILNNLGCLTLARGEPASAWELLQRALGAAHAAYGPNHPDVASILLNLGDVLRRQGSHASARAQYTRALVIDEIAYGPNHADVARDLARLADLLADTGDHAAARKHFARALAIDEAVYGSKHPNLISRLNDLGRCLKALNEVDEAVKCFTRTAELSRSLPTRPAPSAVAAESTEAA